MGEVEKPTALSSFPGPNMVEEENNFHRLSSEFHMGVMACTPVYTYGTCIFTQRHRDTDTPLVDKIHTQVRKRVGHLT